MLKIGEFAQLAQVSVKTLRHYDKLGLLPPASTDPESGYRLYKMDQLGDMMRILALRDCGFALDEISNLLKSPGEVIETIVAERIADQQQLIEKEQARLQRLLARRQQLKSMTTTLAYDFVLKETEAHTLVGQRQTLAEQQQIAPFVQQVLQELRDHLIVPGEPLVHLYFNVDREKIDLFVGGPVMALPALLGNLQVYRITAGGTVASVLHRGHYSTVRQTAMALDDWIERSGYQRSEPVYEIYHRSPSHTETPTDYLTELQIPITRFTSEQ